MKQYLIHEVWRGINRDVFPPSTAHIQGEIQENETLMSYILLEDLHQHVTQHKHVRHFHHRRSAVLTARPQRHTSTYTTTTTSCTPSSGGAMVLRTAVYVQYGYEEVQLQRGEAPQCVLHSLWLLYDVHKNKIIGLTE